MPIILKDLATRNTIVRISSFTVGSATAIAPAGGETVTITGTGFTTGLSVLVASTSAVATVVNSTTLTFTSPANTAGNYNLTITNADGTSATKTSALLYFAPPSWSTAAGSLAGASIGVPYNQTLVATGGTITYSITSGSLPTGLSLNTTTGVISGTVSTIGSSSFTVAATNQYNQIVTRSFSIAVGSSPTTIDYVMIAGGGGGGIGSNWANNAGGGGGGAGGYLTGTGISISSGVTYTITVGTGGAGAIVTNVSSLASISSPAADGLNSSISGSGFGTITSIGGGGGGSYTPTNGITAGRNGGSGGGGGGAGSGQNRAGGVGVYPGSTYLNQARQGYDGGANFPNDGTGASGGGGGASQQGFAGTSSQGGQGGLGVVNPFAVTVGQFSSGQYYLGGGGGGSYGAANFQGPGGIGGGAAGKTAANTVTTGNNATNGTGGGGGGLAFASGGSQAGRGGDGVVVIRYPISFTTAATTGSPTETTDATYRYYTFTTSGTISWN